MHFKLLQYWVYISIALAAVHHHTHAMFLMLLLPDHIYVHAIGRTR